MIEVIAVFVIVGILTAVAIVRFTSGTHNAVMGVANQLISDINFAQEKAIAEHRGTKVIINGGATPPPRRCFVATVCYGEQSSQVARLRAFRDEYLDRAEIGRKFIKWYYEYGPLLAEWVSESPILRVAVKVALAPIVIIITPFVSDAFGAGGGGGGGGGGGDEGGLPNTYEIRYSDNTLLTNPQTGGTFVVGMEEGIAITSSNRTIRFDSNGRLTFVNYSWGSGETSTILLTLNSTVNLRIARLTGKTWIE